MTTMESQITSLTVVYSTVYSDADQRKHQSSASLAFLRGIHRGPVNSPHTWPVTRKMFPFDDVIMLWEENISLFLSNWTGSAILALKHACVHWSIDHWSGHDDVIKWKHFPRYWPFVRGIHQWPVSSPHKRQWRGALVFSLICAWINGWVNNREAGDLRRHRTHYDVTVMEMP